MCTYILYYIIFLVCVCSYDIYTPLTFGIQDRQNLLKPAGLRPSLPDDRVASAPTRVADHDTGRNWETDERKLGPEDLQFRRPWTSPGRCHETQKTPAKPREVLSGFFLGSWRAKNGERVESS